MPGPKLYRLHCRYYFRLNLKDFEFVETSLVSYSSHKNKTLQMEPFILAEDAVIRTVDNGDGTTTRTITCPVDTETTRYTLEGLKSLIS